MRDLYMKTGDGFLLVFSITSRTSLQELAVLRSEISRIKDEDDTPIVIVGNKADLEDQRAVARTKAFAVSQKWGAPYYEASARTRSECKFVKATRHGHAIDLLLANVDEVFVDLCRQMLRRDDAATDAGYSEDTTYYSKHDSHISTSTSRSKKKRRKEGSPRCVIL
jgi:Ras-related protein Rap-1B